MQAPSLEFSICTGRDCIGRAVEQAPQRWAAFSADDELIGVYPSRREATSAIISVAQAATATR
jgi:hypothetical protein